MARKTEYLNILYNDILQISKKYFDLGLENINSGAGDELLQAMEDKYICLKLMMLIIEQEKIKDIGVPEGDCQLLPLESIIDLIEKMKVK